MTPPMRPLALAQRRGLVDAQHDPPRRVRQVAIAQERVSQQMVRDRSISSTAISQSEIGGLVDDDLGPTLVELTGLEQRQDLREVLDQRPGEPEEPATTVRGLVTRQTDLARHRPLTDRRPHPGLVQPRRQPRLPRTHRRLQPLDLLQLRHTLPRRRGQRIECEHVFDCTLPAIGWQPPDSTGQRRPRHHHPVGAACGHRLPVVGKREHGDQQRPAAPRRPGSLIDVQGTPELETTCAGNRSRSTRRASRACDFTVPTAMPSTSAVSASDRSSK